MIACSAPTENSAAFGSAAQERIVSVSAAEIQYRAATASSIIAVLPVTLRNTGEESLFFNGCEDMLSRETPDGWRGVWWQPCITRIPRPPSQELAAGTQISFNLSVFNTAGNSIGWTAFSGQYRLTINLRRKGAPLSLEERTSAPFEMRVE
jgi:hypothetical protein